MDTDCEINRTMREAAQCLALAAELTTKDNVVAAARALEQAEVLVHRAGQQMSAELQRRAGG